MAAQLRSLVDGGVVRVLDLLLVRKEPDGSVEVAELAGVDKSNVGELVQLEADLALLLAEEDVEEIGAVLEPGSIAAVLVYDMRRGSGWRVVRTRAHKRAAGGSTAARGARRVLRRVSAGRRRQAAWGRRSRSGGRWAASPGPLGPVRHRAQRGVRPGHLA